MRTRLEPFCSKREGDCVLGFFAILNVCYRIIVFFILAAAVVNVLSLKDWRKQIMTTMIIIPLVLRVLNIK